MVYAQVPRVRFCSKIHIMISLGYVKLEYMILSAHINPIWLTAASIDFSKVFLPHKCMLLVIIFGSVHNFAAQVCVENGFSTRK